MSRQLNDYTNDTDVSVLQDDDSLAEEIAQYIQQEFSQDDITAARGRFLEAKWPEQYRNSETGRLYKPHHKQEELMCYSDTPLNCAVLGGEGCVAAETLINGVPIAELTTSPSTVSTLVGESRASRAYLKGQASLYQILTQSGREVVVTPQHRFLTPTGWYPLQSLGVGALLAAHDSERVHSLNRKRVNSQGDYSLGRYQYGELYSPWEVAVLDKLRQLRNFVYGNNAWFLSPFSPSYKICFSPHKELIRRQSEFLLRMLLTVYESALGTIQGCEQCRRRSRQPHNVWQVHPLARRISQVLQRGLLSRASSELLRDSHEEFLSCFQSSECFGSYSTIGEFHPDCIQSLVHEEYHACLPVVSLTTAKFLASSPPLLNFRILYMLELSLRLIDQCNASSFSTYDYNIFWDEVQDISFVKDGDYYDIHVPFVNHYIGNGIVHHNSGKTTVATIKTLNRLRRGCNGALLSPDFEHLKRSAWPEFRRWCPWDMVVERHQYLQELDRLPQRPFQMVFNNEVGTQSVLMCGGAYESEPEAWEGPNINFAWLDEMRRHKTPAILKVITGRVRIPGPHGEPPQLYISTTPRKHWLYDYFGPMICTCAQCHTEYEWDLAINTSPVCPKCGSKLYTTDEQFHNFKRNAAVVRLFTKENEENLYKGFYEQRASSLTEKESRELLDAEWEDTSEDLTFLPSMELWDRLQSNSIPKLSSTDPLILGIDAAKGRVNDVADCFAIVGVTRHWEKDKRRNHTVVRYVRVWQAPRGKQIDFIGTEANPGPELEIRRLCKQYNVAHIAYDPYQLHDMMTRLTNEHIAWTKEVSQGKERLQADSDLLQVIIEGRITHDGNKILQEHIRNADKSVDDSGSKCRIVKREDSRKIDALVALSMANYRCLYLNIGLDKPRV